MRSMRQRLLTRIACLNMLVSLLGAQAVQPGQKFAADLLLRHTGNHKLVEQETAQMILGDQQNLERVQTMLNACAQIFPSAHGKTHCMAQWQGNSGIRPMRGNMHMTMLNFITSEGYGGGLMYILGPRVSRCQMISVVESMTQGGLFA